MTRYELINPSDPYIFEADDFEVAAVMVCALGDGHYGAKEIGGYEKKVPIFLFGGQDQWFRSQFSRTFAASVAAVMQDRRAALADCFASVRIPAGRKRSSLNDIREEAAEWAGRLRANVTVKL